MGKGKGKKGRKEEKAAARAAQKDKLTGLPKPAKPQKKEKVKKPRPENTNPPGPANYPIPMGRPKPFTKSPQHAKWPALFKKHLGVIEAHIRSLDRVMQSMKSQMAEMEEKERLEWELGEKGNWRVICSMMDRAREVLANAREAAKGILPSRSLRDKKGLGVAGTNFEPLGPKLAERAKALEMDKKVNGEADKDASADTDGDEDTEMSDASDDSDASSTSSSSESESDAAVEQSFVSLPVDNKKRKGSDSEESSESDESKENEEEPNPYFVIDTKPTPVVLNENGVDKKRTQGSNNDSGKEMAVKKVKVEETITEEYLPEPEQSKVDFAAIQAQLQAEVEAGLKAQQESEATESKKDKKKRKRSSGGVTEEAREKKVKKDKDKEKSEKKRKVDDSADGEEVVEGKKKKRKHKV